MKNDIINRIVITGPESTGKSELSINLAKHFNTIYVKEFARDYVLSINRNYSYNDVEIIAKKQIEQLTLNYKDANKFIFFDTGLIITKIWFKVVYNKVPKFLLDALENIKIDFFLLCYPDIEWISDDVRENGGENRMKLFYEYKKELDKLNFNYEIVKGIGQIRTENALRLLSSAQGLHIN